MDKKMTSGEIAKKAGISQKAVRLYDEKGLLKPSEYSEGNYRLYDPEALLVLEKIIALKQIGFSLEEIKDNLVKGSDKDILTTLNEQIDLMEAKRYELEKAVTRIKAVIARSKGEPDWDDVADILKSAQLDQDKDAGHFFALDHQKDAIDWYVKIFRFMNFSKGQRVLDLGCGFSKLWRNNWTDIPEGIKIDGYDIRGSWADDFEKFVADNKDRLPEGVDIDLYFEDLDEDATWAHIKGEEKYDVIICHYTIDALKDPEKLIAGSAQMLAEGGYMSLNAFGDYGRERFDFWYDAFEAMGLNAYVLDRQKDRFDELHAQCKDVLQRYFSRIDERTLDSPFTFDDPEDIVKDLEKLLEGEEQFIEKNKKTIVQYFDGVLKNGNVVIPHDGWFWKLGK